MKLKFTKMHGLGNDFVVFDAISQSLNLSPAQFRFIADRHFGIGCDQILLVERATRPDADFRYRIFNADGGEVEQCGNGARCFVRFVHDKALSPKTEIRVETASGIIVPRLEPNGQVTVNMGVPRFEPAEIPFVAEKRAPTYLLGLEGKLAEVSVLSMGNPHAVQLVEDAEARRLPRRGRRSKATRAFLRGSTPASCRCSTAAASSCGCTSAVPAKPWHAAPAPVPQWWRGSCADCWMARYV